MPFAKMGSTGRDTRGDGELSVLSGGVTFLMPGDMPLLEYKFQFSQNSGW